MNPRLFRRWALVGWSSAILAGALAFLFGQGSLTDDTLAAALRLTARFGFVFFLLAFSASSLHALFPASWSRWLHANRRYLGVSFALAFLVHLGTLAARALYTAGASLADKTIVDAVGGGLAYLLIVLMLLTSFDRTTAWLGHRRWTALHTVGSYVVSTVFLVTYGQAAAYSPLYLPPLLLLLAAYGLRLARRLAGRRVAVGGRLAPDGS